ncbi:hypothetical protein D9M70_582920 [compost metagenome]
MLVAASMPALPAADMNCRVSLLFSAAKLSTVATTRLRVSALWSERNTLMVSRSQFWLKSSRGARVMMAFNRPWLRGISYQDMLPSFIPAEACLLSAASELVETTPGSCCSCASRASTLTRVS